MIVAHLNAACVLAGMHAAAAGKPAVDGESFTQGLLESADLAHADDGGTLSRLLTTLSGGVEALYLFPPASSAALTPATPGAGERSPPTAEGRHRRARRRRLARRIVVETLVHRAMRGAPPHSTCRARNSERAPGRSASSAEHRARAAAAQRTQGQTGRRRQTRPVGPPTARDKRPARRAAQPAEAEWYSYVHV